MEVGPLVGLGIVAALIANAVFVATEFAYVTARRSRMEEPAAAGSGGASVALRALGHVDRYVAGSQLGITCVGWSITRAVSIAVTTTTSPLEVLREGMQAPRRPARLSWKRRSPAGESTAATADRAFEKPSIKVAARADTSGANGGRPHSAASFRRARRRARHRVGVP